MKILRGIIRKEEGQVLAVSALTMLSLLMFWVVVINMGPLVRDQIIVQNAVDNAAQTAATIQARAYNRVGHYNANISEIMTQSINYGGDPIRENSPDWLWYEDENPIYIWDPEPSPLPVTALPPFAPSPARVNWHYSEVVAGEYKEMIEGVTKAGEGNDAIDSWMAFGEEGARYFATGVAINSGADGLGDLSGGSQYDLKLAKYEGRVRYFGTTTRTQTWWEWVCTVWQPDTGCCLVGSWAQHSEVDYWPGDSHFVAWWPGAIDGTGYPNAAGWAYMEDVDRFAENRQEFVAWKSYEPLFGGLIEAAAGSIVAVAASRVYHTTPRGDHEIFVNASGFVGMDTGPMFLERSYEGMSNITHIAGEKYRAAQWGGWRAQLISR